jgi:hypothetical protein
LQQLQGHHRTNAGQDANHLPAGKQSVTNHSQNVQHSLN